MITRSIQKELIVCAKEYPAVTILGPRQSGKTTLSKMAFADYEYCSLEDPDTRRQAMNDPKGLLGAFSGGHMASVHRLRKIRRIYTRPCAEHAPEPARCVATNLSMGLTIGQ